MFCASIFSICSETTFSITFEYLVMWQENPHDLFLQLVQTFSVLNPDKWSAASIGA